MCTVVYQYTFCLTQFLKKITISIWPFGYCFNMMRISEKPNQTNTKWTKSTKKVNIFRLLDDNTTAHTSEIVKQFPKSEKVTVLSHPLYSTDLAHPPLRLFPLSKTEKKFLSGQRYTSLQTSPWLSRQQGTSELFPNQSILTHSRSGLGIEHFEGM